MTLSITSIITTVLSWLFKKRRELKKLLASFMKGEFDSPQVAKLKLKVARSVRKLIRQLMLESSLRLLIKDSGGNIKLAINVIEELESLIRRKGSA